MANASEVRELGNKIVDFLNESPRFLLQMIADTAYVGFNPKTVATFLYSCFKKSKKAGENDSRFFSEMTILITLFLHRGIVVIGPKKMCTLPREKQKKLAELKKRYFISAELRNSTKHSAITLPRIAACFPQLTVRIMKGADMDRPVATSQVESKYPEFTKEMRTSAWFALIPHNGQYMGTVKALLYYQYLERKVINTKNKKYSELAPEDQIREVLKYARLSYDSDLLTTEQQNTFFAKYATDAMKAAGTNAIWSKQFDETFPGLVSQVQDIFGAY